MGTAAVLSHQPVMAEEFPIPGKAIKIVVPYSPGGLTDIVFRRIGEGLSSALGVPVLIDNRPGVAGIPAIMSLRGMPADGHTLYAGYLGSHATNTTLYKNLPYDPVKDFTPIGMINESQIVMVINPKLPIKTLPELIAYAKANPGKLNWASTGSGGPAHLALEMMKHEANIDIVHIPYRGTAQVLPDLISGVIQGYFDAVPTAIPNLKARNTRAIAVLSPERVPQLPSIPTARESGLDIVLTTWYGLLAYGQVNPAVRDKLASALDSVVGSPDFARWSEDRGMRRLQGSPIEFKTFMASETERLGKIIRTSNIQLD